MNLRIAGGLLAPRRLLAVVAGIGVVTGVTVAVASPAAADTGNRAPFVIMGPYYSGSTVTRYCLKIAYDPSAIAYYAVGSACTPDTAGRASQWLLTPLAADSGYVQIESVSLVGSCLEDVGSTKVWLKRCDATNAGQRWLIEAGISETVTYQSAGTGRYLTVSGNSAGTQSKPDPLLLVPSGSAYLQIRSEYSGKCMDVDNNPGGTRVQQWTCLGSAQLNQLFHAMPSGWADYYTYPMYLSPRHTSGLAVQPDCTAKYDCPENRTPLINSSLMGSRIAVWHIRFVEWQPDGLLFTLVNFEYDTCADLRVEGAGHDDGTVIQEWQCLGTGQRNQLWHITVP